MIHRHHQEKLYDNASGALVVLTAYDAVQLSGDMQAPFLQEASFWWLTGINEPGWKVIFDSARRQAVLVRPERSQVDVIFNGAMSDDEVRTQSGIDTIIPAKEFESHLRQLHRRHAIVQTIMSKSHYDFIPNPSQHELLQTIERIFDSVGDISGVLYGLRAIKQPHEIEQIRKAVKLTTKTFAEVRALLSSTKTEYMLEAEFTYRFRRANAQHAYEPIVAAGAHACTLHYIENRAKIGPRDMVLIDIGARVDGYCADITRTYCLNPTKRQRQVHEAVQAAQKKIIMLIEPGLLVADYIKQSDDIMKHTLMSLGLLEDLSDQETYRKYMPHSVSHGLGVDVHDSLGAPRYFEPGMVLTVEPGIYIAEEKIGVRIEDDILVTESGHENLSAALPTGL